jgi:serine/threonine-protein kinase
MPATMAPDTTTVLDRTASSGAPGVLYDEERRPRRLAPILLIILVVLLGLGAIAFAGYQLFRTKSYEVPDLIGVDEAIARNEVAGNDWTIVTEHERSDAQPEIGSVIRTEPLAGAMLDEGDSILFVISDGPELRTLPDFVGDELQAARDELYDLALESEVLDAEYSEDVPAGLVISWSVRDNPALVAGAQVLPGTVIELVPSQGPEPRKVPELVGLNAEQARAELRSLRLRGDRGDDVFSDDVEAGIIVQQSPPAGTTVERGSRVSFQVSKGPDLVTLPDLEGLTYAEAEEALLDAGFSIGDLLGTTEGTFVSLSIDGAEAEPGESFRRGTAVDLIFL